MDPPALSRGSRMDQHASGQMQSYNVSSLPIMVKGEQFLRVIGIFTLYVATIKLAYKENNP
jgi:hypothetical protein